MRAAGLLFLQRTRPLATRAASGEFQLQLFTVSRDRREGLPDVVERWVLHWSGPKAQAFWEQHRHQLTPGSAVEVTADRLRSHVMRDCAPEIHAQVTSMQLAATPETRRATAAAH